MKKHEKTFAFNVDISRLYKTTENRDISLTEWYNQSECIFTRR